MKIENLSLQYQEETKNFSCEHHESKAGAIIANKLAAIKEKNGFFRQLYDQAERELKEPTLDFVITQDSLKLQNSTKTGLDRKIFTLDLTNPQLTAIQKEIHQLLEDIGAIYQDCVGQNFQKLKQAPTILQRAPTICPRRHYPESCPHRKAYKHCHSYPPIESRSCALKKEQTSPRQDPIPLTTLAKKEETPYRTQGSLTTDKETIPSPKRRSTASDHRFSIQQEKARACSKKEGLNSSLESTLGTKTKESLSSDQKPIERVARRGLHSYQFPYLGRKKRKTHFDPLLLSSQRASNKTQGLIHQHCDKLKELIKWIKEPNLTEVQRNELLACPEKPETQQLLFNLWLLNQEKNKSQDEKDTYSLGKLYMLKESNEKIAQAYKLIVLDDIIRLFENAPKEAYSVYQQLDDEDRNAIEGLLWEVDGGDKTKVCNWGKVAMEDEAFDTTQKAAALQRYRDKLIAKQSP